MHVQFVGLPGCGKSTIAGYLTGIGSDYRRVPIRYEKLSRLILSRPARAIPLCLRLTPFASLAWRMSAAGMSLSARLAPLPTLLNLLLAYDDLSTVNSKTAGLAAADQASTERLVHVFDEFVYQRALGYFGCFDRVPPAATVCALVDAFEDYQALPVFFDVDPGVCLQRAQSRSDGLPARIATLDQAGRERVYRNQAEVMELLMNTCSNAVLVKNTDDPLACAHDLRDKLEHLTAANP